MKAAAFLVAMFAAVPAMAQVAPDQVNTAFANGITVLTNMYQQIAMDQRQITALQAEVAKLQAEVKAKSGTPPTP